MGCSLSKQSTDNTDKIDKIDKTKIKKYTFDLTPAFNNCLENKLVQARVVDIYDGDTLICVFNVFDNYYLFHVRLAGIDTCEIQSKNEKCKELAYKARKRMYQLVTLSEPKSKNDIDLRTSRKDIRAFLHLDVYLVNILCGKLDKYGRLLGWIFNESDYSKFKSNSYNNKLVIEKLAYEYSGDTKLSEDEQLNLLYRK